MVKTSQARNDGVPTLIRIVHYTFSMCAMKQPASAFLT